LRAVRTFLVKDVSADGVRILPQALFMPNVPQYGEAFPGINTLLVTRRTVRPVEGSMVDFYIVVEYGFPEIVVDQFFDNPPGDDVEPRIELDTATVIKRTNIAIAINPGTNRPAKIPIRITGYLPITYNDDGTPTGFASEPAPDQGGMVDMPVPMAVFRFHRREYPIDSQQRTIRGKQKFFVGRTNSTEIDGDPRHTWLCSRIGAVSDDGWNTVNVTYEFQYNPDTWDPTISYIDPTTGQPGDGVGVIFEPGFGLSLNGMAQFQVADDADFNHLDLYI
jgi:hypothetical protein